MSVHSFAASPIIWIDTGVDLRPLLTCTDSAVMVSAARVVGNMVRIAGATLGDPFFTKEIDQALQMLEGMFGGSLAPPDGPLM